MARFDYLKSLVRSAAEVAGKGVRAGVRVGMRSMPGIEELRERFAELQQRRVPVTEASVGRYLTRAPEVVAATARITHGAIRVEAQYEDGDALSVAIRPLEARWSPRGAKELVFEVEPAEVARSGRVRALVGCVAASIARAIWAPILAKEEPARIDAMVHSEGEHLYIDLRSLPAVREAMDKGPAAMIIEVLRIGALELTEGTLYLKIELPLAPRG